MTDSVDQATRSRMMAAVRAKDTQPELAVRRHLHSRGLRYRLHARDLPGSPDIVLPKWCAVVLVHGCFWHRHDACKRTTMPATRPDFWAAKFEGNVRRDRRQLEALKTLGWRVFVFWACQAGDKKALENLAASIVLPPRSTQTGPPNVI